MIVVDANVALAWVLQDTDEHRQYSIGIAKLSESGTEALIAPSVTPGEVAYVLLSRGRTLKWRATRVEEMAEVIDQFQIRLVAATLPLATLIRFATRHNVSGCYAFYLALAMSAGAKLATLDKGLWRSLPAHSLTAASSGSARSAQACPYNFELEEAWPSGLRLQS